MTGDEPDNKLNALIRNAHRIWQETSEHRYCQRDGTPFPTAGAAQMIFSDLGTLSAEDTRGFSAYRWIRNELIRLIAAALSGDRTIRTIDDIGDTANQFALAKAIASGDARLLQKAGLEGEIARLDRQRAAHFDDQLNVRRQVANTEFDLQSARRRVEQIGEDLRQHVSTRGDAFVLHWGGKRIEDRRTAVSVRPLHIRRSRLIVGTYFEAWQIFWPASRPAMTSACSLVSMS